MAQEVPGDKLVPMDVLEALDLLVPRDLADPWVTPEVSVLTERPELLVPPVVMVHREALVRTV